MQFLDPDKNPINCSQFLEIYEPYYYLSGPTYKERLTTKHQAAPYVEKVMREYLEKAGTAKLGGDIGVDELKFILGWKKRLIKRVPSQKKQKIVYDPVWKNSNRDRAGRDFTKDMNHLVEDMEAFNHTVQSSQIEKTFNFASNKKRYPYMTPTLLLTIAAFLSRGRYPIYDRYKDIATIAIKRNARVGGYLKYDSITTAEEYLAFLDRIKELKQICPKNFDHPKMFISRSADRALWAYGHFFVTTLQS